MSSRSQDECSEGHFSGAAMRSPKRSGGRLRIVALSVMVLPIQLPNYRTVFQLAEQTDWTAPTS